MDTRTNFVDSLALKTGKENPFNSFISVHQRNKWIEEYWLKNGRVNNYAKIKTPFIFRTSKTIKGYNFNRWEKLFFCYLLNLSSFIYETELKKFSFPLSNPLFKLPNKLTINDIFPESSQHKNVNKIIEMIKSFYQNKAFNGITQINGDNVTITSLIHEISFSTKNVKPAYIEITINANALPFLIQTTEDKRNYTTVFFNEIEKLYSWKATNFYMIVNYYFHFNLHNLKDKQKNTEFRFWFTIEQLNYLLNNGEEIKRFDNFFNLIIKKIVKEINDAELVFRISDILLYNSSNKIAAANEKIESIGFVCQLRQVEESFFYDKHKIICTDKEGKPLIDENNLPIYKTNLPFKVVRK